MRRLTLVPAWIAAALLASPVSLSAQTERCMLLPEPRPREAERVVGEDGQPTFYVSGPARFTCTGNIVLEADSAIVYTGRSEIELIGDVFYRDSVKILTADTVNYYGNRERLWARGHVVLTDRSTRSVIRGPELEYLRAGPDRPVSLTRVRGRPHAVLREQTAEADADSAAAPLEIDADRIEIEGKRHFRADGRVVLVRGEVHGSGAHAEFDRAGDRLILRGDAHIRGEAFQLFGERIETELSGDRLEHVEARRQARLLAEDLRVEAPRLDIFFDEGVLHRLVAVRAPVNSAAAPADSAAARARPARARAFAEEFRLVADSITALAPGRRLERIVAVGDAYGRRTADTVAAGPAPGDSTAVESPDIVSTDWLRGDTIIGHFAAADSAAPTVSPDSMAADSARAERVLERLVAIGGDGSARSMYRLPTAEDESGRPAVNYIIARRITLFFQQGEVQRMEAAGPVRGMHLVPTSGERPGPAEEDTGTAESVEAPVAGAAAAGRPPEGGASWSG